jgi:hypothetical protein
MMASNIDIESKGATTTTTTAVKLQEPWYKNTLISLYIMYATCITQFIGLFIGFLDLERAAYQDVATLLSVALPGWLSFVRHSIFHRSDEKRIGWTMRSVDSNNIDDASSSTSGDRFTNFFLIEVGMANLSWGFLAFLSVICKWNLAVKAASSLVYGIYLSQVGVMLIALQAMRHHGSRSMGMTFAMITVGVLQVILGANYMKLSNQQDYLAK